MALPIRDREDDLYELADDSTAPSKVGEGAVGPAIRPAPRVAPLGYERKDPNPDERYSPDRIKNLYLPLILIGGGMIVHFGYALLFRTPIRGVSAQMTYIALNMLIGTALMLVAILIAGKLRGINLGSLPVAAMKLCAISIAPGAVAILIRPMLALVPVISGLLIWILQFVVYFALLGAMFDLDESDTWFCVCIMFLVNVSVFLLSRWAF